MLVTMLKSKIHRATVTHADLHYVGSLTVDRDLLDSAALHVGERVAVVDINNGERLETYVIEGDRGSGIVGVNGAASRLVHTGDLIIVLAYALVNEHELGDFTPMIVHVDEDNRATAVGSDAAELVAAKGTGSLRAAPRAFT
jgi:aspartate 1-decarboxylase